MTASQPGSGHRAQAGQQLRGLAAALEHETGLRVEVVYDGPRGLQGDQAPGVRLDAVTRQRVPLAGLD
jgi:hypothetical protein